MEEVMDEKKGKRGSLLNIEVHIPSRGYHCASSIFESLTGGMYYAALAKQIVETMPRDELIQYLAEIFLGIESLKLRDVRKECPCIRNTAMQQNEGIKAKPHLCANGVELDGESMQGFQRAVEKMDKKLSELSDPVLLVAVRQCVDAVLLEIVNLKFKVKVGEVSLTSKENV